MRNAILAETIVETINGGSLNKTGEVKILRMLVSGCSGSRPLYFEFCTRLLVNNIKFQKRLSFEEGLQVFEDCIKALPRKSRTITHHYALWLSSRGEDPKKALEVINGTFQIPEDPSVADSEPDGLLHTTAAKLSLRVIRADPSVVEEYKQEALYHIQKIRSTGFFDEKAIHILSGIVIQLVKVYPNKIDQLKLINTTLADIDRVLFKSDSIFNQTWRSSLETNWLQTRRIELFELTVKNSESLEAYAEKVWSEYESQDGYIVLLRQKFHKARTSKKGTLFKKALEACDRIIKKIESAKKSVSSGLYEVKSHIFYQWRVKNSRAIKAHGHTAAIDWKILKETSKKVIQLSEDQNSLLFAKYLHALSLCHLDEWGGANEIFRDIRKNNSLGKQLYHTRDVLVDRTGMKRRVQGRVKRGSRKRYFCPESIPTEFVLSTNKMWPKHDAPIHVFIEFSFAGTTATPC